MVSAPERLHLDPAELMPRAIGRYTPLVVDHGRGLYVWDTAGDRYADYTSGIGVVNTGHCHPRVVEAIREQAGKIIHAQANILAHEPMLNAARALTSTLPASLNQVFWTNSGAEAIEGALKLAKIATGRPAIIAFRGAFHGRTHAAMSVTSSRVKVRGHYEPLLPSVYFAPYPYLFRSPYKGSPEEQDLRYFAELEEMFDQLPEVTPERRELALKVNREYNVFCDFPRNVTTAERLSMRRMIRDAIPEVAVKHGIALMEGGLDREYQEEAARIFEVQSATESATA